MVAFNKMWEDVWKLLSEESVEDLNIVEKFKSGFIVKENDLTTFVTRDDFVDFWCKLLYFNEVSEAQLTMLEEPKLKYVYTIVKKLPYLNEEKGILKLIQ